MATVHLNGEFLPQESACISVLDRGFIFGDGVYEVVPVFGGHILRLHEHLERLQASLTAIYVDNPHTASEWQSIVEELIRRNAGARDCSVYIQVTRGSGSRDHVSKSVLTPTVFAMCTPIPDRNPEAGVRAVTREDIRWSWCHIKATSLLPSVLLREEAMRADGATEAILVRDGRVTEGAASNVFVVHGDGVRTPPKGRSLLPGITRDLVVELLREHGEDCRETPVSREDLEGADEVWITSSTMGIAPVTVLDGRPVGAGGPGPIWKRADRLYQAFKVGA